LYDQYMTVSAPDSDTKMYMVNVDGELSEGFSAEVVEVGDPIDMLEETGKDIAVLKVNEDNLPTVALGDDSDLKDGELAIALGYPSVATFDPAFDPSEVEPTLTQGTISAQKTMEGGWKVIQTDADIKGGSSGSPLLDDMGEAIGVNTFGATELNDQTGEVETQPGFNFAVPATVAKEFLDQANVTPELGALTLTFREGVDLYLDDHFSDAKEKFEEVKAANADFPYVTEYIENSSAAISDGLDKSSSTIPDWLLYVLIGGGVLLGVGGGTYLVMKSNKKKKAAAAAGAGTAAATAPAEEAATAAAPATDAPVEEAPTTEAPVASETDAATDEIPAAETATTEAAAPEAAATEGGDSAEHNFCAKCGQQLTAGAEFCSKCGEHVE
jgi:hypothetical protein